MSDKTYHHGDLRLELIEKSVELISKNGIGALSLRKVASKCGVSHSAPYAHFKSKEALLKAISDHIADKLATTLKTSAGEPSIDGLVNLGWAYVMFFARYPQYYSFVFASDYVEVGDNPYEPYDFFKRYLKELFIKINHPEEKWQNTFIAQWAMFHGLASIAIMQEADDPSKYESTVREILTKNYIITTGGN
ncbi:MAG: TetR/AcrR family transcriptional regulator [Defluviitaleaceae bacterium]|nr:TetR/AcrR family transcriptional regulator [Defluviitaleaceae bacterium]